MRIATTTLFALRQYVLLGVYNPAFTLYASEEIVVDVFNKLFNGEIEREASGDYNTYKHHFSLIPPIDVILNKDMNFEIVGNHSEFLSALIVGMHGQKGERFLCFKLNEKGYSNNYFSYIEEKDIDIDEYVPLSAVVYGAYKQKEKHNQNLKRLIAILFEREYPIIKHWNSSEEIMMDYSNDEKCKLGLRNDKIKKMS